VAKPPGQNLGQGHLGHAYSNSRSQQSGRSKNRRFCFTYRGETVVLDGHKLSALERIDRSEPTGVERELA
jgi:hypothetical protein